MQNTSRFFSLSLLLVATLALMIVAGCGGDIGSECRQNADCSERCLTGSEFPDGMCTVSCDDDYDCPGGTVCVEKRDGVCLLECERSRDCPGGYECDDKDRRGSGGKADVCIGD